MPFDAKDTDTIAAIKTAVDEAVATATTGLLSKRDELLGTNKDLKTKIDALNAAETTRQSESDALTAEQLKKDGKFDELLEQQKTQYMDLIKTEKTRGDKLMDLIHTSKIREAATREIASQKGSSELLLPHIEGRMKLDDNMNVIVMNADGTQMLTADGSYASVKDLVTSFKADTLYGRGFEASAGGGSGSHSSTFDGDGGAGNPFKAPEGGAVNMTTAIGAYRSMKEAGKGELARQMAAEVGLNIPATA